MHARIDESFTLVYDAVVSREGVESALPSAMATGVAVAEQVSTAQPVDEGPVDAEILSDNLTRGANLGAGFAKWSPDSGETSVTGSVRSSAVRWVMSPRISRGRFR